MSFSVETVELVAFAGTLDACRDDVEAIRRYVHRWTDFRTTGELLPLIADPHDAVVDNTTGLLRRIDTLLEDSATAVRHTVGSYRATDHSHAATFDATLPTGTRPDPGTTGIYHPHHARPADVDQCVGSPVDVTSHLTAPPEPHGPVDALGTVSELISPSAWIDAVLRGAIGRAPFAETTTFFAGDWAGYARCAEAFGRVNEALNAVAVNLSFRTERLGFTWTGHAADTANSYFHGLAEAIAAQRWVFQKLRREYLKAAAAAWHAAEIVSSAVNGLADELCLIALGSLAGALVSGGLGTAIAAGLVAERALALAHRWERATKEMTKALTVWHSFAFVVTGLSSELARFTHPLPADPYVAQVA